MSLKVLHSLILYNASVALRGSDRSQVTASTSLGLNPLTLARSSRNHELYAVVSLPDHRGLCLPSFLLALAVVSQRWVTVCQKCCDLCWNGRATVQLYCSADQSWALNLLLQDCLHFPTLHCAHILSPKYSNQRLYVSPPISCALMTLNRNDSSGAELF